MPSTPRKRLLAVAALLGATSALAACGDGPAPPKTPVTPATAITRAAYIDTADGLCARVHANMAAINAEAVRTVRKAPTAAAALDRLAPLLARAAGDWEMALDEFRTIAPPPGDRAEIARYRTGIEARLALLVREERAARAGDLATYEALVARQDDIERRSERHARSYGFRTCGQR